MKILPICKTCDWCAWWKKCGNRYDLECYKNRNLGAVGENYNKCPSYQNNGREINEHNLHDHRTAQQDPKARMERDHQDSRHTQVDYREGNGTRRL